MLSLSALQLPFVVHPILGLSPPLLKHYTPFTECTGRPGTRFDGRGRPTIEAASGRPFFPTPIISRATPPTYNS
jgi:hypothetical protein